MGYRLEGRMLEACSCDVICPCWVGQDPDGGNCEGVAFWHVDKGAIEGIDVTGRTIGVVAHIPGNATEAGTGLAGDGPPRRRRSRPPNRQDALAGGLGPGRARAAPVRRDLSQVGRRGPLQLVAVPISCPRRARRPGGRCAAGDRGGSGHGTAPGRHRAGRARRFGVLVHPRRADAGRERGSLRMHRARPPASTSSGPASALQGLFLSEHA
ncbi:MAG: DUF1326 domain-containing protein [Acidimicrobiia bacterium]|nr:DUF1326 domain-containing protein [Acidimicrobiia bacterium]